MLRNGFGAARLKLTLLLHGFCTASGRLLHAVQMVHHHGSPAPPALPDDIRGIVSV